MTWADMLDEGEEVEVEGETAERQEWVENRREMNEEQQEEDGKRRQQEEQQEEERIRRRQQEEQQEEESKRRLQEKYQESEWRQQEMQGRGKGDRKREGERRCWPESWTMLCIDIRFPSFKQAGWDVAWSLDTILNQDFNLQNPCCGFTSGRRSGSNFAPHASILAKLVQSQQRVKGYWIWTQSKSTVTSVWAQAEGQCLVRDARHVWMECLRINFWTFVASSWQRFLDKAWNSFFTTHFRPSGARPISNVARRCGR